MRLNETKRKQRTSQEEVLAELFAEAELQGSVRKKKNWDAWMESEVEQQIDEEIRMYLAESSDPHCVSDPKGSKSLEPDAEIQTTAIVAERIPTGIQRVAGRRTESFRRS